MSGEAEMGRTMDVSQQISQLLPFIGLFDCDNCTYMESSLLHSTDVGKRVGDVPGTVHGGYSSGLL